MRITADGQPRRAPAADFGGGVSAAARGYTLLTRDASLSGTGFPAVPLPAS